MKKVAEHIHGYTYGTSTVASSAVSLKQLDDLKISTGFTAEDQRYLQLAGSVLEGQTRQIVAHWRSGIIAGIPNLARHSRTPEGEPNPDYLAKSNLRFEQWILDTCLRPYDQEWLDYQQEIALRHTSLKKNKTDEARSTSHVPLRDIIAFIAVINETINPTLPRKGIQPMTWRGCTEHGVNPCSCSRLSGRNPMLTQRKHSMSGKGSVVDGTTSKVWLVTGASRGLGRAIAEAALSKGHKVVATARNPERLKDLILEYGGQVQAVALDVTSEAAASHAVSVAIESFGRLDVLVNNAGYGDVRPIEDTSIADFRAQIETNLFGVIIVTKAALPFMRMQGTGHILQISSVGGRLGPMGRGPYAAAKWGVEGFSEVLAKEVSPLGIKVTIVEPGGFRTDFAGASTSIYEGRPEYDSTVGKTARFQRDFNGKQPGDPAKAADVLVHIASLESPPLRLLLGSDAFHAAEQNDIAKMKLDQDSRDLTFSTDFSKT